MERWIRLSTKILSNDEIWGVNEPFDSRSAWIDLLLLTEWKDHKAITGSGVKEFKRGYVYRSITELAERWRWDRRKVTRFLEDLQAAGMVMYIAKPKIGTIIFIRKYKEYQQNSGGAMHKKCTNDGTNDAHTYRKNIEITHRTCARRNDFHNFEERDTNYAEMMEANE